MGQQFERVPPQNIEAERAVLGAILVNSDSIHKVKSMLTAGKQEFYVQAHQKIYACMLDIADSRKPVDPITLMDDLTENGWMQAVGGAGYIAELGGVVPTTANIEHYAQIVHDAYMLRRVIEIGQVIIGQAYGHTDPSSLIPQTISDLHGLTTSQAREGKHVVDIRPSYEAHIEAIRDGSSPMLLTGVRPLDNRLRIGGGLHGRFVTIAATPSDGKTSMAITIAFNLAHAGVPVLIQSSESSQYEFLTRLDRHAVPEHEYRTAEANARVRNTQVPLREAIARYKTFTNKLPIIVDDSNADLDTRIASTYGYKAKHGIQVVIWDYLQEFHINMPDRASAEERYREMVRRLNKARRDMNTAFIVLSQFRKDEFTDDRRPTKGHLLGTGATEQASDIILILWVPQKHKNEPYADIDVHVAKQRDGPTGWVNCEFHKPQALIREKERDRVLSYQEQPQLDFVTTAQAPQGDDDDDDYNPPF